MKKEFSKKILATVAKATAAIVVAAFVLMWHKAKAENMIKLDIERKKLGLKTSDGPGDQDQTDPDIDPEE